MGLTRAACTQDTPSGGVISPRRPNRRVSQTYRRLLLQLLFNTTRAHTPDPQATVAGLDGC